MKRALVVVRHAKSDWATGGPDHERPLNERGRRDAPVLGRWLRENLEDGIGLVVCSTATRARQTWRLAADAFDPAPPARFEERVYGAEPAALMSVIDELDDDVTTAALVGHNPGLSELVRLVTGDAVELKTSAVAVLAWAGPWADVWVRRGSLVAHATPRG
jgi:phosphohistidine phosphatase